MRRLRLVAAAAWFGIFMGLLPPIAPARGVPPDGQDLAFDHSQLLVYRDSQGRPQPVCAPEDWSRRRAEILRGMQAAMGDLPDRDAARRCPLDVQELKREERQGYSLATITYLAEPGHRVPAYLYLPTGLSPHERRPAVLALHQTDPRGKQTVDGDGHNELPYGRELAQRGYVVLAPDYPSLGDYNYRFDDAHYASTTMKGIFNHQRGLDLLESLDAVDGRRLGAIGHSLGGHNAMFLAVFDPRVRAVVSSCGWTPFPDYQSGDLTGWTGPRYMPRLRDRYGLDPNQVPFDFPEVVAALAPRPFLSVSPLNDANFSAAGVQKAMPLAGQVYALFDAEDRLQARYPLCKHDFPREERAAAYAFLDQALWPERAGK